LERVAGTPHERLVNEMVLRTQAQAVYKPSNLGHFGLGLRRYSHFTSPIRRYADLLVHRALIRGLDSSENDLSLGIEASFEKAGEHLSMTERRAMTAERDTIDRYLTAYLSDSIGATFTGHITGVTRFGLFVALEDSGAEGLIPISTLPGGIYRHDPRRHTLAGKSGHRIFTLGATVEVRLTEADTTKGSMVFQLCDAGSEPKGRRPRRAKIERRRKRRR